MNKTIAKNAHVANISRTAQLVKQAALLIPRLEKLLPDSRWQHRISGSRGALLRLTAAYSANPKQVLSQEEAALLARAVEHAYHILETAALQIEGEE